MEVAGCRSSDGKNWCHFHPNHLVIGICAFCLNQKLLILQEHQEHLLLQQANSRTRRRRSRTPHIHKLPFKIFTHITSPFLSQIKNKSSSFNTHVSTSSSSSPSTQEESFISIKFEENGAASWEKTTTMEKYCDMTRNQKTVDLIKKKEDVEGVVRAVVLVEPRGGGGEGASSLRWQKRIRHLFQIMRWKKSSSSSAAAAMGNVGTKIEGVKVRHGWIRTLTNQQHQQKKKVDKDVLNFPPTHNYRYI